jgi:hypothetical protein
MCTTSSSPRKRRTTASSRRAAAFAAALLAVACGPRHRETFVTYFDGDHAVSVRHPASWQTSALEDQQLGIWYRSFRAPGPRVVPDRGSVSIHDFRAPVSATLQVGPVTDSLDQYAATYLAGNAVTSTGPEERQGVPGKSWVFSSANGKSKYRLLLLAQRATWPAQGTQVVGLYAQGEAAAVDEHAAVLDEMFSSLTLERPDHYPVAEFKDQRASVGIPPSWRETRRFSGGGTLVANYVSPALAVDEGGQPVHASLAITFEAVPEGGGLAQYYDATRRRLGDNFQVRSHVPFKGGYVDTERTETPVAVSFVKRYYFAEGGRACSLSFEAREDVFLRASPWADSIASTLRFGEMGEAAK